METQIEQLQARLTTFLQEQTFPVFADKVAEMQAVFTALSAADETLVQGLAAAGEDRRKVTLAGLEYAKALYAHFSEAKSALPERWEFDAAIPVFRPGMEALMAEFPETVVVTQGRERFYPILGDSAGIRLRKFAKRSRRNFKSAGRKLGNAFRKTKQAERPWPQEVPFRAMAQMYLQNGIGADLTDLLRDLDQHLVGALRGMRAWLFVVENHIVYAEKSPLPERPLPEILDRMAELPDKLHGRLESSLKGRMAEFLALLPRAGTLELPTSMVAEAARKSAEEMRLRKAVTLMTPWKYSLDSLLSVLKGQSMLGKLQFELLHHASRQCGSIFTRVDNRLNPFLDAGATRLAEMIAEVEASPQKKAELTPLFTKQREAAREELGKAGMHLLSEALLAQNFPMVVEKVAHIAKEGLPSREAKWLVIPDAEEGKPILKSRVEQIPFREVLDHEVMPEFDAELQTTRNSLVEAVMSLRNQASEIVQVVDFNLETGLEVLNSPEGDPQRAAESVLEGLKRAQANLSDLQAGIQDMATTTRDRVETAAGKVASQIQATKDSSKVMELRARLLRAKALERGEAARQKVWNYFRYGIPMLWGWTKAKFSHLRKEAEELSVKLGLSRQQGIITSHISDFLAESELAISKLPLVYQRLFRGDTVTDDLLFVPRPEAMTSLQLAYDNWAKGRYAPTVLVGEPGSGRSSLLGIFIRNTNLGPVNVVHLQPELRVTSEGGLCKLIAEVLEIEACDDIESLVAAINALPKKVVIVVEDLERYFLKHVDGFRVMKAFLQIFSGTNKRAFWLCSVSPYAWQYLCKTLAMDDYFGYIVRLEAFTNAQIQEIVLKRHRLSGYKLDFLHSEQDLKNQTYRRTAPEKRSEYLQQTYFADLNRFATSNLGIAFLFWMRSCVSVEEQVIKIGSLKDIDFSFMEEMSPKKAIALYQILLHGGLTIAEYARVFNQGAGAAMSMMILLLDDGILIRKGELFIINPLLYKNTIRLLEKRNFIH